MVANPKSIDGLHMVRCITTPTAVNEIYAWNVACSFYSVPASGFLQFAGENIELVPKVEQFSTNVAFSASRKYYVSVSSHSFAAFKTHDRPEAKNASKRVETSSNLFPLSWPLYHLIFLVSKFDCRSDSKFAWFAEFLKINYSWQNSSETREIGEKIKTWIIRPILTKPTTIFEIRRYPFAEIDYDKTSSY